MVANSYRYRRRVAQKNVTPLPPPVAGVASPQRKKRGGCGLTHLHLTNLDNVSLRGINCLAISPLHRSLIELKLHGLKGSAASEWVCKHVGRFFGLKVLFISCMQLSELAVGYLVERASLQHLQSLTLLRVEPFSDGEIKALTALPRLRRLSIDLSCVTDAGVEDISHLSLEALNLLKSNSLTDAGVFHVSGMRSLRTLRVPCAKLSVRGFALLSRLVNLHTLELSHVPDAVVQQGTVATLLMPLTQLRSLTIHASKESDSICFTAPHHTQERLTTLALTASGGGSGAGIGTFTALRRLDRSWSTGVDLSLLHIAGLANLVELRLSNSDLTDRGMAALRQSHCRETLQLLDIRHCDVTDAGMKDLAHVSGLVDLDISGCTRVTDIGMWYLSRKLLNLSYLTLHRCPLVSDKGLRYLASTLVRMVHIGIGTSRSISDVGVMKLAVSMPCLTGINLGKSPHVTADCVALLHNTSNGGGTPLRLRNDYDASPRPFRRNRNED
jgi:hypothetical protein